MSGYQGKFLYKERPPPPLPPKRLGNAIYLHRYHERKYYASVTTQMKFTGCRKNVPLIKKKAYKLHTITKEV